MILSDGLGLWERLQVADQADNRSRDDESENPNGPRARKIVDEARRPIEGIDVSFERPTFSSILKNIKRICRSNHTS